MTGKPTVLGGGDTVGSTPWEVFNALDAEFHFTLDVCADASNTKCANFLSGPCRRDFCWAKEPRCIVDCQCECGLCTDWGTNVCWMNPPYERGEIDRWIRKAVYSAKHGATVVALLHIASSPQWAQMAVANCSEYRSVHPRIQYSGPDSRNPRDSMILVFQPGLALFGRALVRNWTWL